MELKQRLSDLGMFKSRCLAIIGKGCLSKEVAFLCSEHGLKVFFFTDKYTGDDEDSIKFIPLEEGKGENRWTCLKSLSLIIILSCSEGILEEILFSAIPFCRIIIIGPIGGILYNMDFYSTVHIKNLELIFLPL
jgi:hypothetical protein